MLNRAAVHSMKGIHQLKLERFEQLLALPRYASCCLLHNMQKAFSIKLSWLLLALTIVISSCSSSPQVKPVVTPSPQSKVEKPVGKSGKINLNNACDIYKKRPKWLVGSLEASRKWQVPLFVFLAIVHQESHFVATARPPNPNKKSKKKYASSAFGYAQALDGTWKEYQQNTGNTSGRRDDFSSAVDFIGWYVLKAHTKNNISKWATDKLYLNYHEGLTGYKRKTYKRKPWLIKVATKVKRRGSSYAKQLTSCNIPLYVKASGKISQTQNKPGLPVTDEIKKVLHRKGIWF